LIKDNTVTATPASPKGYTEFEFDLPEALLRELIVALDATPTAELVSSVTSKIPNEQGVYQLFEDDTLVYIGKTDGDKVGLASRLSQHASKIRHRPALTGRMTFKAVRVMVFTAMDLEKLLIKHYRALGAVAWNGSGFGSNDTGNKRESTERDLTGFHAMYPISIDEKIDIATLVPGAKVVVATALKAMKDAVDYILRYETLRNAKGRAMSGRPHADLLAVEFVVPAAPYTIEDLLRAIVASLGPEWQATLFDSHVILYKEDTTYTFGRKI
jgi:hypothetical protein